MKIIIIIIITNLMYVDMEKILENIWKVGAIIAKPHKPHVFYFKINGGLIEWMKSLISELYHYNVYMSSSWLESS